MCFWKYYQAIPGHMTFNFHIRRIQLLLFFFDWTKVPSESPSIITPINSQSSRTGKYRIGCFTILF